MGIKHLNNFLRVCCSQRSMCKTHLSSLRGKVIVIDTSIYLYKFLEKNCLLEHLYLMISIFRKYGVIPVFVFDGKPPAEKKELLIQRKKEKDAAEVQYNELLKHAAENAIQISEIEPELDKLKKRFIRVKDADIRLAKELMSLYGIQYIDSWGESDQLCAYLVQHNYAWACMSDDMDMFLYECPRVLRHFSLMNHDAIYYNTKHILSELDMTARSFRDIMILSGTDYNLRDNINLHDTIEKYREYRGALQCAFAQSGEPDFSRWENVPIAFYDWVNIHPNKPRHFPDTEKMDKIRAMFDLNKYAVKNREEIKRVLDHIPFHMKDYSTNEICEFMRQDGFIFV